MVHWLSIVKTCRVPHHGNTWKLDTLRLQANCVQDLLSLSWYKRRNSMSPSACVHFSALINHVSMMHYGKNQQVLQLRRKRAYSIPKIERWPSVSAISKMIGGSATPDINQQQKDDENYKQANPFHSSNGIIQEHNKWQRGKIDGGKLNLRRLGSNQQTKPDDRLLESMNPFMTSTLNVRTIREESKRK